MKSICFFTNGHNGDIVHSKSFIQEITTQLDIPCLYHHHNNFKISQDLLATTTQIAPNNYYDKFIETPNIFFVNTWLWPYLLDNSFKDVNLETNYEIYKNICEVINAKFNTNIKLQNIESYFPFINFDLVQRKNIDDYVLNNRNKKVLLSNGPCLSGQTQYNEDMSSIIERLALQYQDITFIATQTFKTTSNNIHFTDDIIQIKGCDLNEIGYLSTFCNLIVGKNSGPFCFSTIKENYNDSTKIFYAFGHRKSDCFHGNVPINAKFFFDNASDENMLYNSINSIIEENLI